MFYLSFVITPFCSNASELMSSLIFASKKKKVNTSLTYSQVRMYVWRDMWELLGRAWASPTLAWLHCAVRVYVWCLVDLALTINFKSADFTCTCTIIFNSTNPRCKDISIYLFGGLWRQQWWRPLMNLQYASIKSSRFTCVERPFNEPFRSVPFPFLYRSNFTQYLFRSVPFSTQIDRPF